ncbi:MAG: electron transfer flavoprotein subunit beta/FixA family protein [Deltaproteobacteria bacterium]|nr:electron transfer flavoprotein subunit beta/FixA family protein [Deltaproteobacteria bacterium]MBW2344409.1 electron transfer flavoprotein subunit beta/FixA family protein [Deltaproteobacteria bacterium]
MKILVCVKHVPESGSVIGIDDSERWIRAEKSTTYKMNRFDAFAVEEALLIRQAFPGTRVEAVSVGPDRTAMVVKRAIGMGADNGVHMAIGDHGYLSPFTVASLIAGYAHDRHYDLILTGVMAEDDMQGMVGPMLAELLFLPCATFIIFEKISPGAETIYVEREIKGGYRDALELKLPAVLTIQGGINKPRYPSLSNMLRAKNQKLETIVARLDEQPGPREEVMRVSYPRKSRSGMVLEGSQQEKAAQLLKILRGKTLI